MRFTSLILSLVVLALTFVPCTDFDHPHVGADNIYEIEQHRHEHDEDCDGDTCSPFCTCACCHTNVVLIHIELYPEKYSVEHHTDLVDGYRDRLTDGYSQSTSHPPIV